MRHYYIQEEIRKNFMSAGHKKLMNEVMNDGPPWFRNCEDKEEYEIMCSIKGRRPIIASEHEHMYYEKGVRRYSRNCVV